MMVLGHLLFLGELASLLLEGDESTGIVLFRSGDIFRLNHTEESSLAIRWVLVRG